MPTGFLHVGDVINSVPNDVPPLAKTLPSRGWELREALVLNSVQTCIHRHGISMQKEMMKARLKVGPSYPEASADALAMGTLGDFVCPAGSEVRGEGPRRNWAQDGGQPYHICMW